MLMPVLSVTLIGIIAAAVAVFAWRRPFFGSVTLGFVGAWAGFAAGALIGVIIDVLFGAGVFVAILGHFAAAVCALLIVRSGLLTTKGAAGSRKAKQ